MHVKQAKKQHRVLTFFLKLVLWLLAVPLALFALLVFALQFPKTQALLAEQAARYLAQKIKSKVVLQRLSLSLSGDIQLHQLYVEDLKKDTLAYSELLDVRFDLPSLFSKKIELSSIELNNFTGHVYRNKQGFNFDFIIAAFAGQQKDTVKVEKPAEGGGWQFAIGNVQLQSVYVTYHDSVSGTNADAKVGNLRTVISRFDLDKKIIHVKSILLENTNALLVQNAPQQQDTSAAQPFTYDIAVKDVNINHVKAGYIQNSGNKMQLKADLSTLKLRVDNMDLVKQKVNVSEFDLANSSISFVSEPAQQVENKDTTHVTGASKLNWFVTLKKLDLANNTLAYDDNAKAPAGKGMDFNHLLASQLNVQVKNVLVDPQKIQADVDNISVAEKSGFQLLHFSSKVTYDSAHVALQQLALQTGNSNVKGSLSASYPSLQALKEAIASLGIDAQFQQAKLSSKDVLFFAPTVFNDPKLSPYKNLQLLVNGSIKGSLDDLNLNNFQLQTGSNTVLKLNGKLRHVTEPKNLYAHLQEIYLVSTKQDVAALLPDSLLPNSIALPATFKLQGNFEGYIKNFNAALRVTTSSGNVQALVKMDPKAGNHEQPYKGSIVVEALDLGQILNQPATLGPVSLKAEINGSGFDSSMQANVNAEVEKAVFKGYEYRHVKVSGHANNHSFSGNASANDQNLAFDFNGSLNFGQQHPAYVFTLNLQGADLKALNLTKENIRLSALIRSDIRDRAGANLGGQASINNLLVIRDEKKYRLDSLVLRSAFKDSVSEIRLSSEVFTADLEGQVVLSQLGASLQKQLSTYFDMQPKTTGKQLPAEKFNFSFSVIDPKFFTNLVPGLAHLSPLTVNGAFNSDKNSLHMDANVPEIVYNGIRVDSLKTTVQADGEKLSYQLNVAEISNPSLRVQNMYLGGELKNNSFSFQWNAAKDDSTKLLAIGGLLKSNAGSYALHFNPELIFNAENWNIDPSNTLVFSKAGLYAQQLNISNGPKQIAINSSQKMAAAPLEVKFSNFELLTLSKIIENKPDLIGGTVNGSVVLEKHNGAAAFRSDLDIKNFHFNAVPIGDIKLKADNYESASTYAMNLLVHGNGNDIEAKGSYNTAGKNSNLDVKVDIRSLQLATIEPFTFGQVTRMSGALQGQFTVKGKTSDPDINGELNFKESKFRPKILDTYLTIHEGKLALDNDKARISSIAIYDSLGNKAMVSGLVDISQLDNVRYDLKVNTQNFLALNTKRGDNALYYGRVFLDSDIGLHGTAAAPTLNIKARLNKGTMLTYVRPQSQVSKSEHLGIVEFTDSLRLDTSIMLRNNADTTQPGAMVKGVELAATISFDKSVMLKMLVDQESGDSLFVVGGGTLDFTMDRSGKTSLTGKYKINDGGYHLSISDVVKRDFKIVPGSSITWSGDMMDAYVDLKAIYTIKTSPVDLMQDEIAGMSELEKNKYRNLLTFDVYLKMAGFLSSPEISFDIQLSPGDRGALGGVVNSRLGELREDETELNKQVFALLTLRRFVGDNPLESGDSGGGLSSASRSSASKVLTQQLNTLSQKYVTFVDLDLGVNSFEDYSTGQEQGRTQLQVGVSKQLLNDKITVRVGGNVELEGERAQQNNASDVAGNISIDYKLTQDGRYKLKAFRENQYENPIEGELTKTGMGVIYMRNYNKIKELLKKPVKINNNINNNKNDQKD